MERDTRVQLVLAVKVQEMGIIYLAEWGQQVILNESF